MEFSFVIAISISDEKSDFTCAAERRHTNWASGYVTQSEANKQQVTSLFFIAFLAQQHTHTWLSALTNDKINLIYEKMGFRNFKQYFGFQSEIIELNYKYG